MNDERGTMKVSLICALGNNNEIGRGNELLWRISEDLKRFKRITTGHSIVMGRKTYESIGRPLPNRTNIIMTRDESFEAEGCVVVHTLDSALNVAASSDGSDEVFIVGGGEIYKQTIDMADRLYLTLVDDAPADADTFFPDYSEFSRVIESSVGHCNELSYKFIVCER